MPHSSVTGVSTARETFCEPALRSPASTYTPNRLAEALGNLAQTHTPTHNESLMTEWRAEVAAATVVAYVFLVEKGYFCLFKERLVGVSQGFTLSAVQNT